MFNDSIDRQELQKEMEKFLNKGGEIKVLPSQPDGIVNRVDNQFNEFVTLENRKVTT